MNYFVYILARAGQRQLYFTFNDQFALAFDPLLPFQRCAMRTALMIGISTRFGGGGGSPHNPFLEASPAGKSPHFTAHV